MQNWVLLRKGADFENIARKFHISPRLACLIRNRDIIGEEEIEYYLNGTIADLYDGMLMKDMDKAVEILKEKIGEGKKIRIIGDYDIDGVNATYILLEGFRGLKATVDVDIPDRMKDGYGLNKNLIDRAFDADVDTIVTCDNGIAAKYEIAYGKSLGMTVIITDHHEVPYTENEDGRREYEYPPADAVVDPKRVDCEYPFKGLCGAAVAYKLVEALYAAMGKDPEDVDYLMEEVAIATVGDVMDLVSENRIFVKQGLEMLKKTKNLGLKALLDCTGVPVEKLSAYHIGFVIGPCINAGGRLDTAKRALELLEAKTRKEADVLAGDLKALNDSRKEMTEKAVKEAVEQVESSLRRDKVLVIYLPDCHESLAGIVAGRIRERYYKPVFVLTKGEECIKGSGRSIETYHMYEGLNRLSCLLLKFGGHKLAAGLSLEEEKIGPLRLMLNEQCGLSDQDVIEKVSIDMQMPFSCVTEAFIKEIARLEPFGKGNTRPIFVEKEVEVLETKIVGKNHNVLKLKLRDSHGTCMDGLYFGDAKKLQSVCKERKMSFTYYPGMNEFMGRKTPQITIQNYR